MALMKKSNEKRQKVTFPKWRSPKENIEGTAHIEHKCSYVLALIHGMGTAGNDREWQGTALMRKSEQIG